MSSEDVDPRVREFEAQLDQSLAELATSQVGGTEALRLAANIAEMAYATKSGSGSWLVDGLHVLSPNLILGGRGVGVDMETLVSDLNFAAHYHKLRDLLYYTYNAPDAMEWTFGEETVEVRFADPSIPRQFFVVANNHYLGSMETFASLDIREDLEQLLRGTPEFEVTDAGIEAHGLIETEVDLKLGVYFDLVADKSVSVGGYSYADFCTVYRGLVVKALYHRYHCQINDSHGIIEMGLDEIAGDIEESTEDLSADVARQILLDMSYGEHATDVDPLYFSLFRLAGEVDSIIMLPHHFAIWEGFVNFLRVLALRNPQQYLESFSKQIGDGLVHRLADGFHSAGFTADTNVTLPGGDLPDIDLMVMSKEPTLGYVFLICEVKAPLPPRWAKDQLRVLQPDSVAKAFTQLQRILDFLSTEKGIRFLEDRTPAGGLADFEQHAIVIRALVATSDNVGAFFDHEDTPVLDFRTLERMLSRCDGDMHYVLTILSDLPDWADNCYRRRHISVDIGDMTVTYEGIELTALMDFDQASYVSAGIPEQMVRDMIAAGARPLDFLSNEEE